MRLEKRASGFRFKLQEKRWKVLYCDRPLAEVHRADDHRGFVRAPFAGYCDEFLVHAVDVEGKASGIEEELVRLLGSWGKIPVTYAGGVGDFEDLARLKKLGKNMLNVTIGSALDLFGGTMSYEKVKRILSGMTK